MYTDEELNRIKQDEPMKVINIETAEPQQTLHPKYVMNELVRIAVPKKLKLDTVSIQRFMSRLIAKVKRDKQWFPKTKGELEQMARNLRSGRGQTIRRRLLKELKKSKRNRA